MTDVTRRMEDLDEDEIDVYLVFGERALVGEGSSGKHRR